MGVCVCGGIGAIVGAVVGGVAQKHTAKTHIDNLHSFPVRRHHAKEDGAAMDRQRWQKFLVEMSEVRE